MAKRQLLFIKQVFVYTFVAFGGPQAHLSLLLRFFVKKVSFISEEELLELNALSQILPDRKSVV